MKTRRQDTPLPSAYRKTAEVKASYAQDGRGHGMAYARWHSSTPGHVEAFTRQDEHGPVVEIGRAEWLAAVTESTLNNGRLNARPY